MDIFSCGDDWNIQVTRNPHQPSDTGDQLNPLAGGEFVQKIGLYVDDD